MRYCKEMQGHDHIVTVSALTKRITSSLENEFAFIWVQGQITNVARPASGHIYFSLKDDNASLGAVWFKQQQINSERFDPLTGEVYETSPTQSLVHQIANGQEVVCAGRLSVYAPRGVYQLIIEHIEETGTGRLQAEFERLRAQLQQKGFFDPARKRPLPPAPLRIALITSPQGAAIHDFLRIAETRGHGATIRVYPVPVQGDAAPAAICQALQFINTSRQADVIVIIRGGGSLEDLWAFNTEVVAEAIFSSSLPVLAGIGHEIDVSLADMTADVRAATPSHAAQLLWPERREIYTQLYSLRTQLENAIIHALAHAQQQLAYCEQALIWQSPTRHLQLMHQRLEMLFDKLHTSMHHLLQQATDHLHQQSVQLQRSPLQGLHYKTTSLQNLQQRLGHMSKILLIRQEQQLEHASIRLSALDPYAPLAKGYALIQTLTGTILPQVHGVQPGEQLHIIMRDGSIAVTTTKVTPSSPDLQSCKSNKDI